jgi:signal transduction histidine kinase
MNDNSPKILIVDDIHDNIQVAGTILRMKNYKVIFATNGQEALDRLQTNPVDLILLDIMMPEMDGFEVIKHLKSNPATKDIPVIFLTAKNEVDSIVLGFELGAVDYINKPFNAAELLARIHNHLELKRVQKELSDLNDTKDKFFSIIGHDLRGPLGMFKSAIDFLLKDFNLDDKDTLNRVLKSLQSSVNLTYQLLENLLQWAKAQTNIIEFEPKMINLFETSKLVLTLLESSYTRKEISCTIEINPELTVYSDENLVTTTIRNLVSNAIKFTKTHGNIKIKAKEIEQPDGKKKMVQVKISDTGIGISPEKIKKLFKLGEKHISSQGTSGEVGTGLGLILCKEFIEKSGGKISVESEVDKGTTFTFTLPVGQI